MFDIPPDKSWNIIMFDLPPDKTAAKNFRLPLLSPLLAHVVHPANVQIVQNVKILWNDFF